MTNPNLETSYVLDDVLTERRRQDARWGEQNFPDGTGPRRVEPCAGFPITNWALADAARLHCERMASATTITWADIFREEAREVHAAEPNSDELRAELIQVAAVAVAWVEAIDRRWAVGRS